MTDPRLPYDEIDEDFLAPRDPIVGFVKVGGKDPRVRFAKGSGKPWTAPTRYVEPARFEVTTRESEIKEVEGQGKAKGQRFKVDLGYKRDAGFHKAIEDDAPSSLRIRLMWPTWKENLVSFLGAHDGTEWVCRGNGVEATDTKRGACACPCPRLAQFTGTYEGTAPKDKAVCRPRAQLNLILEDAEVFGVFWAYKTTSFESISNLIAGLQNFERLFGRLDGLPLELRVHGATKSYGGGTTTQPIVTVALAASMNTARQLAADAAEESRKFLPAPVEGERYREVVIAELEEEGARDASEFSDRGEEIAEAVVVEAEDEGGGEVEAVESLADDPAEADDPPPDSDRNEEDSYESPEPEEEEPDTDEGGSPDEPTDDPRLRVCRKVLALAGFDEAAVAGRLAYTLKANKLEELADRLERNYPDAWAAVTEPGFFDGAEDGEPDDGLGT